jgi:hypothetical protein
MNTAMATEFDCAFQELLQRECPDGMVRMTTSVNVIWGRPAAA